MKNIKKKKAVDPRRTQLERAAAAASNMKFACEFALECMALQKKAKAPEWVKNLDKSINEVTSILGRHSKGENSSGQRLDKLSTLGAIFLKQVDPKYTLLARVPSFRIPALLM